MDNKLKAIILLFFTFRSLSGSCKLRDFTFSSYVQVKYFQYSVKMSHTIGSFVCSSWGWFLNPAVRKAYVFKILHRINQLNYLNIYLFQRISVIVAGYILREYLGTQENNIPFPMTSYICLTGNFRLFFRDSTYKKQY